MSDFVTLFGQPKSKFTPKKLSGLRIWLRADLGITLNGSNVATWADQSGNGSDVAQADSSKQPAYTASSAVFNGRPCVRGDGTNDVLASTANVWSATTYSLFAVLATVSGKAGEYFANPAVGGDSAEHFYGATETEFKRFNGLTQTLTSATKTLITYTVNGANESLYQNGGNVVSGSSAPTSTNAVLNIFGVGATPLLPRSYDLAELVIINHAATAMEKKRAEAYFSRRYAITLV